MDTFYNPYASALDGLILDDPVSSFFNFCKERESIRFKREKGLDAPWTADPIFQKGRFLNVFREDDRGTKAILNFCKDSKKDLPNLVQAVFFSRWCNNQKILDTLTSRQLQDPKEFKRYLDNIDSWCNTTAYPVEPVTWSNQKYSRLDTATILFNNIKIELSDIITRSNGDVTVSTENINKILNMKNNFPIFMAVMDLAWFRPDIIKPESHVPTGIGAVAYLDRLQKYLNLENHLQTCEKMISLQKDYWPEAKRTFHPIDIEYLSCECRKYYSYVNKTKQFEGKNLFTPKT
jgi:hypothetical protein